MSLSSSATGAGEADGPAHEIAKAYQVLSNGQDEEANEDMDPRKLLSGCWRATKEAGYAIHLSMHPTDGSCTDSVGSS